MWMRQRGRMLIQAKRRPRPPSRPPKLATMIERAVEQADGMEQAMEVAAARRRELVETCRLMKRAADAHAAPRAKRMATTEEVEEGLSDDVLVC